jgi:mono/diheme cytochrome c family protein
MRPGTLALYAILTAGVVAGCAATKPDLDAAAINDGKLVAQRECSSCHAIGTEGASPRSDAPLFRTILSRYHSDTLETELVQGIKLGHPDMPIFQLNPKAVGDLVVYLKSIQQK